MQNTTILEPVILTDFYTSVVYKHKNVYSITDREILRVEKTILGGIIFFLNTPMYSVI